MRSLITAFILICISIGGYADYLKTNRKTSIKTEASSASAVLIQVEIDVTLILLEEEQSNGYYHVRSSLFAGEGWIYRTFVRRYPGDAPGETPTIATGTATTTSSENVEVRIVDVGGGQCNLIKLPGNKYVIYDAGHWDAYGKRTLAQVEDYIAPGSTIELMVLSHTDGDHIGAAENIIRNYKVKKVLWTGYERSMISTAESTDAYTRLKTVLDNPPYALEDINLNERDSTITPGTQLTFGEASLTFLCGFGQPEADWPLQTNAERLNAVSIMMKLSFKGNSVLFCGDAVGRHIGDPANALLGTEKFVVEKASALLPSTIIIAPHHGADNGSSTAFIQKVDPKFVIFSSGHMHQHPTKAAADRYLATNIDINNIFRTDRGDDEFSSTKPYYEWPHLKIDGCSDSYGDDDVNIVLPYNGSMALVSYLAANESCVVDQ
jgi:beta-lactamase superfamily II metal-dependent hydrolase